MDVKRLFLVVLDSYGIGALPDAELFGDKGCNTLASIVKSPAYDTPNLRRLGLFNIEGVDCKEGVSNPQGSYGRMKEVSMGKDTTTGHWEIAGVISKNPMPTYPQGFPEEVLKPFSRQTGRGILCNKPYSGTEVIRDYGEEHLRTGKLIVYTSADSVFQIAAHEALIPPERLYEYCRIARGILKGKHGVGRVIARPFTGEFPNFERTGNRHDFSLEPKGDTMLDILQKHKIETWAVGKIFDIFAGRGIGKNVSIAGNRDGMEKTMEIQKTSFRGLCFVNLVDFDMIYGHRNDVEGYAKAATEFDAQLGEFLEHMQPEDVLMITADHGCDPGAPGTDHTREYVPVLAYGQGVKKGVSVGTRSSFADMGATVLDMFGIQGGLEGSSFWEMIRDDR